MQRDGTWKISPLAHAWKRLLPRATPRLALVGAHAALGPVVRADALLFPALAQVPLRPGNRHAEPPPLPKLKPQTDLLTVDSSPLLSLARTQYNLVAGH